jgi:predicted Rossmann-fold nucleotide-binding protein
MSRRVVEIESLAEFDRQIAAAERLNGWFVQSVDLTGRSAVLERADPLGAVLLGCDLEPATEAALRHRGALIFPQLPELPFDPYRSQLYDAAELYNTGSYADSSDAAIYAWSQTAVPTPTLQHTLAAALHDHAITDALDETLGAHGAHPSRKPMVGVMGGHALTRADPAYRDAVEVGRRLTAAGCTVLTGGGPGAMEAANLGAYLSPWPGAAAEALVALAEVTSYRPSIDSWVEGARTVRSRWPADQAGRSIGIPTWFYGHEPTNLFATDIAKYFTNALREDTLLHRCRGGIIFLPGQAGTVQEIFQATTENFYAASSHLVAPMVLVDRDYWTQRYPAYPLLRELARDRLMAGSVYCADSVEDACTVILDRASWAG